MKKTFYFLLTIMLFIACESTENTTTATEQITTSEDYEPIEKRSEVIEKIYENIPDKENFELNKDFHVMALRGLRMRMTPELKGKPVLTIPYDGIVEQIDNDDYGNLEVEEIKGFIVKGNWMKVRYNGKEGYVFDGFLTKFPLPNILDDLEFDYAKYHSEFEYYLRTKIGNSSEKYDIKKYESCEPTTDSDCICYFKQDFGTVATFSSETCSEVGADYFITINNISLAEAYFIIKAMDLNRQNGTENSNIDVETITYDESQKTINFEMEGAGCYTTIQQVSEEQIKIETYCGC